VEDLNRLLEVRVREVVSTAKRNLLSEALDCHPREIRPPLFPTALQMIGWEWQRQSVKPMFLSQLH
jgi:hypothetical protein